MRARQLAQAGQAGILFFRHDRGEQPVALDLHDVGHFGGEHVIGAAVFGFLDQAHGRIEIGLRREPRPHLNQADREPHAGCSWPLASRGSSLPSASSA